MLDKNEMLRVTAAHFLHVFRSLSKEQQGQLNAFLTIVWENRGMPHQREVENEFLSTLLSGEGPEERSALKAALRARQTSYEVLPIIELCPGDSFVIPYPMIHLGDNSNGTVQYGIDNQGPNQLPNDFEVLYNRPLRNFK